MKELILVVDDSHTNLRLASEILREKYDVATVISGKMVAPYLNKFKPDLILLDIIMPDVDGFEVMKMLKNNEEWAKIPVIFLTADISVETEVKCFELGAADYIRKPFENEIMLTRVSKALELINYRKNLEIAVEKQAGKITRQTKKILEMQKKLLDIQQDVIESMANLIENRDGSTGAHIKRTSNYVKIIADELKRRGLYRDIINDDFVNNIYKAAPMHDIGKISIPDKILKKPAKLTDEEFDIIKTHTVIGGELVRKTLANIEKDAYVDIAYDMAMYHHERWDGNGYPCGLKEKEIPLSARIMAIADVFDALVSERCYKKALDINEAYNIIREQKGKQFDSELVEIFEYLRKDVEKIMEN
ncbi:MAG: response regulator [Lachnospiraceae bacterium]|nr:response regulator [Lachnospiraceae bacterium]